MANEKAIEKAGWGIRQVQGKSISLNRKISLLGFALLLTAGANAAAQDRVDATPNGGRPAVAALKTKAEWVKFLTTLPAGDTVDSSQRGSFTHLDAACS